MTTASVAPRRKQAAEQALLKMKRIATKIRGRRYSAAPSIK